MKINKKPMFVLITLAGLHLFGNDTETLQAALDAHAGRTLRLEGSTYQVAHDARRGPFVLTVPANTHLVGVPGATRIKLCPAESGCAIFGSNSQVETFVMEGVILDGNRADGRDGNTSGIVLDHVKKFISRGNSYKGFSKTGFTLGLRTMADTVLSERDCFADIDLHGAQTYNANFVTIRDGVFEGFKKSPIDINPLLNGSERSKVSIVNNVMTCGRPFTRGWSVLSLMGDDIEAVGNKIVAGGTQIVIHTATGSDFRRPLRHYTIKGNHLWNAEDSAVVVNQDVNSSIVVEGNHIHRASSSGIQISGNYDGSGTTKGHTVISGNIISDGISGSNYQWTNEPACIKLYKSTNVTIMGNICDTPRYAGIELVMDTKNVVIANNIIKDQIGQPVSGHGSFLGGGIVVMTAGAARSLDNISINNNIIENFMAMASPSATVRAGGVVLNGDEGVKVTNVSIKNNKIGKGNGPGITAMHTDKTVISGNEIVGVHDTPVLADSSTNTNLSNH